VVANLPYYITSPVLRYFVEASTKPSLMVMMVQKEVGEAIVAGPGKMSLLAVSLQVYSEPKIISHVPAQSFYPQPKVDSVILRFDVLPEPAVKVADMNGFFEVVKSGFSSPRKQLHNSLAHGLGMKPAEVAPLLKQTDIDPKRRAETLSLEEWAKLYYVLARSGKVGIQC
jgi:16S rRNA (adenine1518-N6/adenine1519-N6)-dimethyltransferase